MTGYDDIFNRLEPGGGYNDLLRIQPPENGQFVDRQLGNYRLTEFVAQGGMSQIYLATRADGVISRNVAIKVSPNSGMSPRLRDRFLREQQVLANLNHENISHLYDVGFSDEGFPYIVMEWIDGRPVDAFCRDEGLTLDARIELLIEVAEAVQFAHSLLVVHRDIKPSNILVEADGSPKLLDFGIAKLLESDADSELTDHMLPLTPAWASPEQLTGGMITVASDVYQLGAVLHLLATEEMPHGEATADLVTLAAGPEDPELPALRNKAVPADVAAIVRKCMRKDPSQRYADVNSLVSDLRAYLAGYPVTATRGAGLYRVGKFLSRNRLPVAISALSAVLLIAGSITYTVNLQNARDLAERQAETSGQLLTAMSELIADTYTELIETRSDRVAAGDLGNEPLRLLLERTNRLIDDSLGNEDVLRAELLRLQGATSRQLSQNEVALAKLTEAKALAEQSGDVPLQIQILRETIILHTESADVEAAQAAVDEAFTLGANLPEDALVLGALHDAAATLYTRYDEFDRARDHIESAIAIYEANPAANPLDLAGSYTQLGVLRGRQEELLAQRELLAKALAIYLEHESPNYRGLAGVYSGIAWSHAMMGEYAEAADFFRKSLEVSRANFGDAHPTTASAHSNVGIALRRQGDLSGALEHLNAALTAARALDDTQGLVGTLLNVGNVYQDLGDLAAAQAAFEEGLAQERVLQETPGDKAFFLNNLGSLLLQRGDFNRGLEHLREALAIKQSTFGPESATAARTMLALVEGQALSEADQNANALLNAAREIYVNQYGEEHPLFAHYQLVAGRYALFEERHADAQSRLEAALTLHRAQDPDFDQPQAVHLLHSLARVQIAMGDQSAAGMSLQRVQHQIDELPAHKLERVEHALLTYEVSAIRCNAASSARDVQKQINAHFPARRDWQRRLQAAAGRCDA